MKRLAALLLAAACNGNGTPLVDPGPVERVDAYVLDFSNEPDVPADRFAAYAAEKGFRPIFGAPVYFHVLDGALHLVAKPGPVHDRRVWLAITDRERLRNGIESKVLLQLTPPDFGLPLTEDAELSFSMAPLDLPEGADLRDSDANDACFYLLLGFGGPAHEYQGVTLPETVAYVWANRRWEEPVARDAEYEAFLRYVAVGAGRDRLGELRTIERNLLDDFRLAFPERGDETPMLRSIAVMADGNTLGTSAASMLRFVKVR